MFFHYLNTSKSGLAFLPMKSEMTPMVNGHESHTFIDSISNQVLCK